MYTFLDPFLGKIVSCFGDAPFPINPTFMIVVVVIEGPPSRLVEGCCNEELCIVDILLSSFEMELELWCLCKELYVSREF